MNQALVTGIEQAIQEAQKAIAQKHEDIQKLKVELEEARKRVFSPFSLTITVSTHEQAIGLRKLTGMNHTMAQHLAAETDIPFETAFAAIDGALDPFYHHISYEGFYKA